MLDLTPRTIELAHRVKHAMIERFGETFVNDAMAELAHRYEVVVTLSQFYLDDGMINSGELIILSTHVLAVLGNIIRLFLS